MLWLVSLDPPLFVGGEKQGFSVFLNLIFYIDNPVSWFKNLNKIEHLREYIQTELFHSSSDPAK